MSRQLWYYETADGSHGPVSVDELRGLAAAGAIRDSDRIRSESMSNWLTLGELKAELLTTSGTPADGVGPDSDQPDIDSIPLVGESELPDIDSFHLSSESEATREDSNAGSPEQDLDIDSFVVAGDSDLPPPKTSHRHVPVEEPDDEEKDTYLVRSLGMVLGPLTQDELVEMAKIGSLTSGDEIKAGDSDWISVESIPSIGAAVQHASVDEGPPASDGQDSAESDKSANRQSRSKSTRKSSAGKRSGAKSAPGRKRKRRKKKKDEFLAEIFAEVFTEDGEVRHERPEPASSSTSGATQHATGPAVDSPTAVPVSAPASATASPVLPPSGAVDANAAGNVSGLNGMANAQPVSPPPRPAFQPPPKARKKKSGGGGISLPEPKVLGMIGGGILVVAILVGGFMGAIPLPGFGVDPETFFQEVAAAYPSAAGGNAAAWKEFNANYGKTAQGLMMDLLEDSKTDEAARRNYEAAKAVVKLTGQPHHYKDGQKAAFKEFQQILVGG